SLFLVNTIIIIALEVPLNDAMSHLPHRTTLMYGALLVAAGFGALQFAKDILGVALTIIIWTFGEMILLPTSSAYAAELSPERKRGVYMGFYQMTFSLALISSPLFGTWIFEHYGASVLYTGALGIGIISAIMFRGFGGTRPPQ
ncbi:MAG TPA: MFS transporter, partial [Bacteroidota bacterium]|nr:MFS transporter [Bacteroidota bacterium]